MPNGTELQTRANSRLARQQARSAKRSGAGALVPLVMVAGGGAALWFLSGHSAAGSSALSDPIPCPPGWSGAVMPSCVPPPCSDSSAIDCPPGESTADLRLVLARLIAKTTFKKSYTYDAIDQLVGLMNQPYATPNDPNGTVGYARTLDAAEAAVLAGA